MASRQIASTVTEARKLLNESKLCEIATSLNNGIECVIDDISFNGQDHGILRLTFSSGERWAVRMPIQGTLSHDEFYLKVLRSTATLLECLGMYGARTPTVHWSCVQWEENVLGYPLILMDWIEGQPLDWESLCAIPLSKERFLKQLARFVFDLATLTKDHPNLVEDLKKLSSQRIEFFDWTENIEKFDTTREWHYKDIDRRITRILKGQLIGVDPLEVLSLRTSIPDYIDEQFDDYIPGLFHDDIHPGNIIVDKDFNLRGIVDWDTVSLVPFQAAIRMPDFLAGLPCAVGPLIVCAEHQRIFMDEVISCELAKYQSTSISRFLVTSISYSWFLAAIHSKEVHRQWFMQHQRKPAEALLDELEKFSADNVSVASDFGGAIANLRHALEKETKI